MAASTTPRKTPKKRPSRARGLRTSTGCFKCRQRRVKCDEGRPKCGQCKKADRDCVYPPSPSSQPSQGSGELQHEQESDLNQSNTNSTDSNENGSLELDNGLDRLEGSVAEDLTSISINRFSTLDELSDIGSIRQNLLHSVSDGVYTRGGFSPHVSFANNSISVLSPSSIPSPDNAPFQWYDLLAEDAVTNYEKNSLFNHSYNLNFDPQSLSRRQSVANVRYTPSTEAGSGTISQPPRKRRSVADPTEESAVVLAEPWNLSQAITLTEAESNYFLHYLRVVAPILDLFDPAKHFGNIVPQLAVRNVGLMKSLLAVAARHKSLTVEDETQYDMSPHHIASDSSNGSSSNNDKQVAAQYYYETLSYLSQAMPLPTYTRSSEILATSIMISTYEMFDGSVDVWDRHLKGSFWIQRGQDNDGESRGLRKAVWWAWVRQDVWAAFRARRRTLTIWKPTKPLSELTSDELATRVIYILAKAVCYVSEDAITTQDFATRLKEGEELLKALQDWYDMLPQSYHPLITIEKDANGTDASFKPLWIHPPSHAAAIQTYCFAKIIVLLNKPSTGGINSFHKPQKQLEEAVQMICGLAHAPHAVEAPSAFVNFQCLFVAGLYARTPDQCDEIMELLKENLKICRFPSHAILDDLRMFWDNRE